MCFVCYRHRAMYKYLKMMKLRKISFCFFLFFVILWHANNIFAESQAKFVCGFLIHHYTTKKCLMAVTPRTVKLGDFTCKEGTILKEAFQWRWTTNGQIQNAKYTMLCLEIDEDVIIKWRHTELRLGECSYRKRLQKWKCEGGRSKYRKSYFINPANLRSRARWHIRIARPKDYKPTVTRSLYYLKYTYFNDKTSAEICDFDHRDHCLQTVAKIPTPDDTCLLTMARPNDTGYAEVKIVDKKPLTDFTVSMWMKTRLSKEMGYKMSVFSYTVNDEVVLSFVQHKRHESRITLFDKQIFVKTDPRTKRVFFEQSFWIHITISRSSRDGTLSYYSNDILLHKQDSVSKKAISGTGVLRFAHSELKGTKFFNGLISQFNIYNQAPRSILSRIQGIIAKQHCCQNGLPHGNWLKWDDVIRSWTLHGNARVDKGVQCTSFEKMSSDWISDEYKRQTCKTTLLVSDPRYIPDYRFSASSWTSAGKPSSGRASKKISNAWCPESNDRESYLQLDLGYVQKVSAIGTMLKLKERHGKRIEVHYSENGILWRSDGKVYEASQRLVPAIRVVPLIAPVTARYLRLHPTGCVPSRCCLAVEVYGCDPEILQKITEVEDGCTRRDKPYLLMYLPVAQHITRIQLLTRKARKPIKSFYMYYMSWRQWIPYQVDGKLKIFSGNSDTSRPFTHILAVPIFTSLIKIFPIPYGNACGNFIFIGCHSPRDDLCTEKQRRKNTDCFSRQAPQCNLGFIGNGHICRDLNECDVKTGAYCDPNSLCRNRRGSFACDPCKNHFIGDGRICQTSCEAFGVTCGANSFCDVDRCKCYEGYVQNGTQGCVDDDKPDEQPTEMQPDEIDGICPDGFFNCYGDVVGTLDKLRKATSQLENVDYHDDCSH